MRRRPKRPDWGLLDPASLVTNLRGIVVPDALLDAEFTRAKKELLARAEKDMSLMERIRFRIDLLRLRRQYRKMKRDAAKW